eukprot:Gb_19794 [translate_table: standard]
MLLSLHALKASPDHRGKYEPTLYGCLLGSLPLSLEASMLVIKFCQYGYLREGALIGSLMDARPMPIRQPFGQQSLFDDYLESYYKCTYESVGSAQKETILMSNLCAIQFWQHVFKDVSSPSEPLASNSLVSVYESYSPSGYFSLKDCASVASHECPMPVPTSKC